MKINNFILWCKGWYDNTEKCNNLFDQARLALKLDGYEFVKKDSDVLKIVLNKFDEINNQRIKYNKNTFTFFNLFEQKNKYKIHYNINDNEALLLAIRYFILDIDKSEVKLEKPIYNKKLRKLGFISPKYKHGMTYKQMNKII